MFFNVTYDANVREGPSTWSQPKLKIEDVPERESSFCLMDEYSSDSSSESFERVPHFNAMAEAEKVSGNKLLVMHPLVPNVGFNYGSKGLFGSSFFNR